LKYLFKNQKNIIKYKITYIGFDINNNEITEDIYEIERKENIFNDFDIENNIELKEIFENNFIEMIVFLDKDNFEKYFFIHYSD
jgi:hypothetical protein